MNNDRWYVEEMIAALNANIEYLEKEGNENIRIRNGSLFAQIAENYIYDFELEYLQEIPTESEIELRINSEVGSGKVLSVNEKKIQIEVDRFFGKTISQANLVISSLYLLKLLRDKLIDKRNNGSDNTMGEKLFGQEQFNIAYDNDYDIPLSKPQDAIDEYKEQALRLSLGSELSFVWGPPGTGKTELISRLIEAFIAKELSVLLISHTNMATDEALYKTARYLEKAPEYKLGQIIRVGDIKKLDLKKEYPNVLPSNASDAASKPIRDELEALEKVKIQLKEEIKNIKELLADYDTLEKSQTDINNFSNQLDRKIYQLRQLEENSKNKSKEIKESNERIEKFQKSNALARFFSGQNLSKLTQEKSTLLVDKERIEEKIDKENESIEEFNKKIMELKNNVLQLKDKMKGVDYEKTNYSLKEKENNLSNIESQIRELNSQLTNISEHIIKEAKVIATTLTKSYSEKLILTREYDCIIIDEASMAPLPALYYASTIAKQKAVIIGDFFQLPPVVKHKVLKNRGKSDEQYLLEEKLVAKWLRQDIFAFSGIEEEITKGNKPNFLTQLKIQYRMHPEIADLINFLIYERYGKGNFKLESSEKTKDNGEKVIDKEPLKDFRLGIYNTNSLNIYPGNTESGSYYNLYQALLAVELAKKALNNGYESIGIISPFRAQANLIAKMVTDEQLENIDVDTVHRFQGGEKQLIIFDITTPKSTKLTDDEEERGDDEKLINVAFSRAKFKCIVIGDVEKILKSQSESSLIRRFVEYVESKGYPIIDSGDIITNYLTSEKAEDWLEKINSVKDIEKEKEKSDIFDQTDFYPHFYKEIIEAKKEIIIHSPFITSYRTRQFLPIFDYLRKKNVNIFIVTRPYWAHKDNMSQEALDMQKEMEKIGVVVLPWGGSIHDKFAIIDRETLWEGSLNILSQNESRERMRRFVGKNSSEQILNFYGISKNIGDMGDNNLKKCRVCDGPGNWFWTEKGVFGVWTHCLIGNHKEGKPPVTLEDRAKKRAENKELRKQAREIKYDGVPVCPKHNLEMVRRKGRWGKDIWGCPKYPVCKFLIPINE